MKKIFAIVTLEFFRSNGMDYAMPFSPEGDMDLFSDRDKALKVFESRTAELSRSYNINFEVVQDDENTKVNLWRCTGGSRTFLKLIETDIN